MSICSGAVLREALASARAERVGSLLTAVLVAGLCLSVLLTTGRTVGIEQQVLATIDDAGTRTIVIKAEPGAGVDSSVIDRLDAVDGVEWAGAFGPALDLRNPRIDGGQAVASRTFYSSRTEMLIEAGSLPVPASVLLSQSASAALAMPDSAGEARTAAGVIVPVVGTIEVPDFLAFMEPMAIVPQTASGPVAVVVVVAQRAVDIPVLTPVVGGALQAQDSSQVSVTTSEDLVQVQAVIAGQLGGYGRSLVLAILSAVGLMVGALMYGLVMIRRKDFGRRRALGASQVLIVVLVLARTAICAGLGSLAGTLAGMAVIAAMGDPVPGAAFTAAVAILATTTCLIAAVVPAVVASRREPLTELRVP